MNYPKETILQALAEMSKEEAVIGYAFKTTSDVLSSFNMSIQSLRSESMDALNNSITFLFRLVNAGRFVVSIEVINVKGLLMETLKKCLLHYLLKRYARRSSKKPIAQYKKELEAWEVNKIGAKPSRYLGKRFISIEEHYETQEDIIDDAPAVIYSNVKFEDIEPHLIQKGLNERDIQVVRLRTEGYEYKEISEITGDEVNALTKRYERAIKKLGIDKNAI